MAFAFWVWVAFLSSLLLCISLVGLAVFNQRVPVAPAPMLLNPRDIDIRIQGQQLYQLDKSAFLRCRPERNAGAGLEYTFDVFGA